MHRLFCFLSLLQRFGYLVHIHAAGRSVEYVFVEASLSVHLVRGAALHAMTCIKYI